MEPTSAKREGRQVLQVEFFHGFLARTSLPGLLDALSDWRPDLILRETTEFSGLIAAEKIGVLHAQFEIINGESEESIATGWSIAQVSCNEALSS